MYTIVKVVIYSIVIDNDSSFRSLISFMYRVRSIYIYEPIQNVNECTWLFMMGFDEHKDPKHRVFGE